jgi:hypothetical protein
LSEVRRLSEKIDTDLRRDTRFENVEFVVCKIATGTINAEIPLIEPSHYKRNALSVGIDASRPERSYELT